MSTSQQHVRAIFKNTAALALSRCIDGGTSLFLSFLVARRLGAAALGIYSATVVFYGLIILAAEMGSTNFVIREVARDKSQTGKYVIHLGTMTFVLSSGIMLLAPLIVPRLGYSHELTTCIYVVICATLPGAWRTIQEAVFVAHQRVEFITCATLFGAFATLITTILLLNRGFGIVSLVLAFAGVQYSACLLYFAFIRWKITHLPFSLSMSFAVDLIKGVRVFAGSSLLGGLFARPEVLLLSFFHNEQQLGFYSAALRLVSVWTVIPQTYMTNAYPVLSQLEYEGDAASSKRFVEKSVRYLLAMSLPLAVGTFAAAKRILLSLYGRGFEDSVSSLKIMAWYIPFAFVSSVLWRLLAARGEQRLVLRVQLFTTVGRLVGGYILIAFFASTGAAIGTTVSLFAYNLGLEWYMRNDWSHSQMLRENWRLFLCALLMGLFIHWTLRYFNLWEVIVSAGAFYTFATFALRVWCPNDIKLFRRVLLAPGTSRRLPHERLAS